MSNRITHILAAVLLLCLATLAHAHPTFEEHRADFYAVLGMKESRQLDEWMKMISSRMIDNYKGEPRDEYGGLGFYDYLKAEFPGFKCQHRLLFHWGYNARPWSKELERKVSALGWAGNPDELKRFQQALITEQRYRNKAANEMTERLFGFASGGKDAGYANALISIVYDIHLIGDYTSDNKKLNGLQDFGSVVGDLVNAIRKIDSAAGATLIQAIQRIGRERIPQARLNADACVQEVQVRADRLMGGLKKDFPPFLKSAQEGHFAKRMCKRGFS